MLQRSVIQFMSATEFDVNSTHFSSMSYINYMSRISLNTFADVHLDNAWWKSKYIVALFSVRRGKVIENAQKKKSQTKFIHHMADIRHWASQSIPDGEVVCWCQTNNLRRKTTLNWQIRPEARISELKRRQKKMFFSRSEMPWRKNLPNLPGSLLLISWNAM